MRSLPHSLACDRENHLGLYEFIEGRQLLPNEVTEKMVRQAIEFYLGLNSRKETPDAKALPGASEACFAIAGHLHCVERRLQRLRGVNGPAGIDREASSFIRNDVSEAWEGVANSVRRRASELDLMIDAEIASRDKCLSPSDFGFHNAILASDGCLRFIDFEYAGWDDPAKLVCDFFCQPAVPVPMAYYDVFAETVASDLSDPPMHIQRMALLLPVYQLKWACIMLNEFLPDGSARRTFARGPTKPKQRKPQQLQKARQVIENLML